MTDSQPSRSIVAILGEISGMFYEPTTLSEAIKGILALVTHPEIKATISEADKETLLITALHHAENLEKLLRQIHHDCYDEYYKLRKLMSQNPDQSP